MADIYKDSKLFIQVANNKLQCDEIIERFESRDMPDYLKASLLKKMQVLIMEMEKTIKKIDVSKLKFQPGKEESGEEAYYQFWEDIDHYNYFTKFMYYAMKMEKQSFQRYLANALGKLFPSDYKIGIPSAQNLIRTLLKKDNLLDNESSIKQLTQRTISGPRLKKLYINFVKVHEGERPVIRIIDNIDHDAGIRYNKIREQVQALKPFAVGEDIDSKLNLEEVEPVYLYDRALRDVVIEGPSSYFIDTSDNLYTITTDKHKANAEYVMNPYTGFVTIQATKLIAAGEEIIVYKKLNLQGDYEYEEPDVEPFNLINDDPASIYNRNIGPQMYGW